MAALPSGIVTYIVERRWGHEHEAHGNGTYRFQSRRGFATWAGLHSDEATDPRKIWDELAPLIKESESCDFVVAIEKHNNPADPERDTHIHALWFATKKTDTRNSRHFDLKGRGGRPLHPFILIPDANGDDRVRQNC